ncbi:hypothetical protein MZM54_00785 [[Brevibacterium] frigoritolerans]|nr:hypothetical protein [Peribacillus frigoritolerans]
MNAIVTKAEDVAVQLSFSIENEEHFGPWVRTHNCDQAGRELADKHYSRQTIGAPRFTRPGTNLVLRTPNGDAIWASWKSNFRRDKLRAYECTIFRNESSYMSSYLIAYACLATFQLYGDIEDGIITYVDDSKVESKNPGFSFQSVGFKKIGRTKKAKLLIFQLKKEALIDYFQTLDLNNEYKTYFDELVNEAIYWAKNEDIYEAAAIFAKAIAIEETLSELYRYARYKLKINLPEKKKFNYFPCLEDFLGWIYGDWIPSEEMEFWKEEVSTKKEEFQFLFNKTRMGQTLNKYN